MRVLLAVVAAASFGSTAMTSSGCEQAWDQHPEFRKVTTIVREGWCCAVPIGWPSGPTVRACSSLPKGVAEFTKSFGADAKPLACRMFPLQLVQHEKTAVLTLRRACPTAAADKGPELKDYLSFARQNAEAGKLLEHTPQAPPIFARQRRSWEDLLVVAKQIERVVDR